ncbi:MAG: hypothetical protein WD068_00145 [Candidatus Babeliales bacterium]
MKRILFFLYCIVVCGVSARLSGNDSELQDACFTGAFTAGYVFKHDCRFKDVYGHGVINVITADGCYYPWECWGIGAKVGYWQATGQTTFLKKCTTLQEVPFTVYARRRKNFDCGVQLYGSLGGGFIWVNEESYLGCVRDYKGIGEVELGLDYPIWRCINITSAFRYLFPSQCLAGNTADVGGFDIRIGLGFSF